MGNSVSNKAENNATSNADGKKTQPNKADLDKNKKAPVADPAKSGSGWFGGIFNKLSMKPKNQMILPEDKDPAVSLILIYLNLFSNMLFS